MGPGASGMRHVTVASGLGNVPFPNKQPALTRPPSTGGPNGVPNQVALGGDRRHRGSRNAKNRTDGNRVNSNASSFAQHNSMQPPLEPVAPLQSTENRWTPNSLVSSRKGPNMDETSPEILDRKVKGLLNKLTMEKFDSISDQIIEWANKSEKENDGRTLMRVIRLVFEKATDEATWSEMYARLCRKMHEKISPGVIDESIKTQDGKPFSGGQLFRKYLLNRCQDDFERGWQKKDAAEAAAAAKAETDKAAESSTAEGDEVLYSEEYYIAQKAKRQGLGLVKFIGELFKLQMLTERIMHQCIKKLLSNVDNPAEEEIESLCKLLSTVGEQLDSPKAKNHMDVYFARMKELAASPRIAPRMQYMLLVRASPSGA
jgi:translation initiation factor 4G